MFFPISLSPLRVSINYNDAAGEYTLVLDTSAALDGLHLPAEGHEYPGPFPARI